MVALLVVCLDKGMHQALLEVLALGAVVALARLEGVVQARQVAMAAQGQPRQSRAQALLGLEVVAVQLHGKLVALELAVLVVAETEIALGTERLQLLTLEAVVAARGTLGLEILVELVARA
jgi:hypothetical protein